MKTLLIDINKMNLLKVVEGADSVRRCEYWADILIPKSEFYICGEAKRDLTPFSLLELQMLYHTITGSDRPFKDYPRALELVKVAIDRFEVDNSTLGQLVTKLGKPLKPVDFKPKKEKPEPKSKQVGLIPNRPKEGTMTARVWECADYLITLPEWDNELDKAFRDEVVKICVANGLNQSTATTQFGKWKKALNAG